MLRVDERYTRNLLENYSLQIEADGSSHLTLSGIMTPKNCPQIIQDPLVFVEAEWNQRAKYSSVISEHK